MAQDLVGCSLGDHHALIHHRDPVSASPLANAISVCVTTIIVIPSAAETLRDLQDLAHAAPDVECRGHLVEQRSTLGDIASARAIATRCCSPPDRRGGYWLRFSSRPTLRSRPSAMSMASALLR